MSTGSPALSDWVRIDAPDSSDSFSSDSDGDDSMSSGTSRSGSGTSGSDTPPHSVVSIATSASGGAGSVSRRAAQRSQTPSVLIVEGTPAPQRRSGGWSLPFTPSQSQNSGRRSDVVPVSSGWRTDLETPQRSESPARSVSSRPRTISEPDAAPSAQYHADVPRTRSTSRITTPVLGASPATTERSTTPPTLSSACEVGAMGQAPSLSGSATATTRKPSAEPSDGDLEEINSVEQGAGGPEAELAIQAPVDPAPLYSAHSVKAPVRRKKSARGCTRFGMVFAVGMAAAMLSTGWVAVQTPTSLAAISARAHSHLSALRDFALEVLPVMAIPPPAAPPQPACNISYSPLPGPRLHAIAASPATGEVWGVGAGVRVQEEPWMAPMPQRDDALWACGSATSPCAGKWRLLDGPRGIQALTAHPNGKGVLAISSGGRFMEVRTTEWAVTGELITPHTIMTPPRDGAALHLHTKPSIAAISNDAFVSHPDGSLHDCSQPRGSMVCVTSTAMSLHSLTVQPQTSALWAVDDEGKVRTAMEPIRAIEPAGWEPVSAPEPIKALAAGPTALRAVAVDGKHLACLWPCKGAWKQVPGQGGSLAEGKHHLYHLSDSGQLSVSEPC